MTYLHNVWDPKNLTCAGPGPCCPCLWRAFPSWNQTKVARIGTRASKYRKRKCCCILLLHGDPASWPCLPTQGVNLHIQCEGLCKHWGLLILGFGDLLNTCHLFPYMVSFLFFFLRISHKHIMCVWLNLPPIPSFPISSLPHHPIFPLNFMCSFYTHWVLLAM